MRPYPTVTRPYQRFRHRGEALIPDVNQLPRLAWPAVVMLSLVTFITFMTLDPHPSVTLSICTALNVAIVLWGACTLYRWDLLLSPAMWILVVPTWAIVYSWGNLGPRMAGPGGYGSNFDSLNYYPQTAILTTLGLLIFCFITFGVFERQMRVQWITYSQLTWRSGQVIAISIIAIGTFVYLSSKYPFAGGYFRSTTSISTFDSFLDDFLYPLVFLMIVSSVSLFHKSQTRKDKAIAITFLWIAILLSVGLRLRSFMAATIIMIGLCWLTLARTKAPTRVILFITAATMGVYMAGSLVKSVQNQNLNKTIWQNISTVVHTDWSTLAKASEKSTNQDFDYRLAGYEYPSAILRAFHNGLQPMYGKGILGGFAQMLPSPIRPSNLLPSERAAISKHFILQGSSRVQGIRQDDSIGSPLTSGLADFGYPLGGPLVYILIALYGVALWRFAQRSPRLFVAYLIALISKGGGPVGDLFWEGAGGFIKVFGFAWIFLFALGFVIMPQIDPEPEPELPARPA